MRLLENENHIFFVRCVAAEAFLVLRDRLAGETLKSETLRMWLTACSAESEAPVTEINNFQSQQDFLKNFIKTTKKERA